MASQTPDLPTLDSALSSLKEQKNTLLGGLAVVVLLVVLVIFFRGKLEQGRVGPWKAALADGMPWSATPDELAQRAADAAGTEVEPVLKYWQIVNLIRDKKEKEALPLLEAFQRDFPDHYLNTRSQFVTEPGLQEFMPPTERIAAETARLAAWAAKHPLPTENPAPSSGHTITLKTDRGDIELGLYSAESPACARALAAHAKLLEGSFIRRCQEGSWLEIGQEEDGRTVDVEVPEERFPPYDRNQLSHLRAAVAFGQRPLSEAPHEMRLKVWLETSFSEDLDSTIVAQVTRGMDLIEALSTSPRSESNPVELAEPLKINEVVVVAPGLVEQAAPEGDGN